MLLSSFACLISLHHQSLAAPDAELKAAAKAISLDAGLSSPGVEQFCKTVRPAKVIGLGEAAHGSHEFFDLKSRLIQRLVESENCRVIAFESGFVQSLGMTRFVAGLDQNVDEALEDQGFWTWQTEEVKGLLVWLRNWNKTKPSKDRVLLVGMDVQEFTDALRCLADLLTKSGSAQLADDSLALLRLRDRDSEVGTRLIMDEVSRCEPKLGALLGEDSKLILEMLSRSLPGYYTHSRLVNMQEDLYDKRPSQEQIEAAQMAAVKLLEASSDLSSELRHGLEALKGGQKAPDLPKLQKAVKELQGRNQSELAEVLDYICIVLWMQKENRFTFRDSAMAENVLWLSSQYPKVKVAVWAHNGHVMSYSSPAPKLLKTMGACLKEKLGPNYHRLGFSFSEGASRALTRTGSLAVQDVLPAKAGSWEASFDSAGPASFFLSLESDGLQNWLDQLKPMRQFGAAYSREEDETYWESLRLKDHFDSIIHVKRITAARPLRPAEG